MKIVAKKSMTYAGRRLSPQDEFEAPYKDARVLVAIGKAGWHIPQRPAAPYAIGGVVAAATAVGEAGPEVVVSRRHYRTRRMKAQG